MEPISIFGFAGTIAGILDILGRSMLSLHDLRHRLKEADLTVTLLIGQLRAVNAALNQIHLWMEESSCEDPNHFQLSLDLESSLSSCHLLIGLIDDQISKLKWDEQDDLKFASRARVILKDARTKDCLNHLGFLVNSLNLLLVVFRCRTSKGQQKLLEDERSREVFSKLKEDSFLIGLYDSGSFSSRRTITTTNTSKYSMRFLFDAELLKHRAYQSTIRALMRRARGKDVPIRITGERNHSELVAALEAEHQIAESRRVDKILKRDARLWCSEFDCLVLGLPGSGMAALVRNIGLRFPAEGQSHDRLLHDQARMRNKDSAIQYRIPIINFTIRSLGAALDGMSVLDEDIRNHLEPYVQLVRDTGNHALTQPLPPDVSSPVIALCKSSVVQESLGYSVSNPPSSAYFFQSIERIVAPEYVPTEDDIAELPKDGVGATLQTKAQFARLRYSFTKCHKPLREMQKLAHLFQGIFLTTFVIDLASYDEMHIDRGVSQNKLLHNIAYVEFITHSSYLREKSTIIILNNFAKFQAKLSKIPLKEALPAYTGGVDASLALAYIVSRLIQVDLSELNQDKLLRFGYIEIEIKYGRCYRYINIMKESDIANARMSMRIINSEAIMQSMVMIGGI